MTLRANQNGSPVYLNIYDITELNYWFHPLGIGAYHTSITVNSAEYYFGQHPYNTTGISYSSGKEMHQPVQSTHTFREQKLLGNTMLTQQEINKVLNELGNGMFTGNRYHLTRRNCNHFTREFAKMLLKNNDYVPGFTNRLAFIAECFRCLWEGHNGDIVLGGKTRENLVKWFAKRDYIRLPGQNYANV